MLLRVFRRNVFSGSLHAILQRAYIGDDAPAVVGRDARRITDHSPETVRDHVKEVANGRVDQFLSEVRRRLTISAPDDHPLPVSQAAMTRRAIYIEALLSTQHVFFCNWDREIIDVVVVDLAGISRRIDPQVSASHRSLHGLPRRPVVGEELALGIGLVFRLVLHVLPASRQREYAKYGGRRGELTSRHQRPPSAPARP